MADENKKIEESTAPTGNIGKGIVVLLIVIALGIIITLITIGLKNSDFNKASMNDIDGDWNSTLTTHSYVFIPKSNIDGLEFTFSIRDKGGKELQQIVKRVGNVKKGQQYTVSFSATEIKDFATLMNSDYTRLTVTGGTKKLI